MVVGLDAALLLLQLVNVEQQNVETLDENLLVSEFPESCRV